MRKFIDELPETFWFVPSIIILFAAALAIALLKLDTTLDWRFFGVGADGSRQMLSAIASSMITVAGVVFSITIVVLSMASSQYSPRVLHNFMRDKANQIVLGVFVGVFTYCLIVLRTIAGGDEEFIPSVSVLVAVLLAFVGVGFLIFFIHHIAYSIQASSILSTVLRRTLSSVEDLFPEEMGSAEEDEATKIEVGSEWIPILSKSSGYIRRVDAELILAMARKHDLVVRMEYGIGDYVVKRTPIVSVSRATDADAIQKSIDQAVVIASYRDVTQDPAFGIQQLVDVALRALSIGINDPTTAISCIDRLSSVLALMASRRVPSRYRFDEEGVLRVIAIGPDFESLVDVAFSQLRLSAANNPSVVKRLLHAIQVIAEHTRSSERHQVLLEQLELILEMAEDDVKSKKDLRSINEFAAQVRLLLRKDTKPASERDFPHFSSKSTHSNDSSVLNKSGIE